MRTETKAVGCGALTVIGVIVITVVLSLGGFMLRVQLAEFFGKGEAHIKIQSAENRIVQHNHFYDLCVSVQNAETGLDAEYARLDQTTDPQARDRIMTNISALTITRANGINTYNADAANDYTKGQFLAANLPYQLSTVDYVRGGQKTQCAN